MDINHCREQLLATSTIKQDRKAISEKFFYGLFMSF
jgi:hypothetical protein